MTVRIDLLFASSPQLFKACGVRHKILTLEHVKVSKTLQSRLLFNNLITSALINCLSSVLNLGNFVAIGRQSDFKFRNNRSQFALQVATPNTRSLSTSRVFPLPPSLIITSMCRRKKSGAYWYILYQEQKLLIDRKPYIREMVFHVLAI